MEVQLKPHEAQQRVLKGLLNRNVQARLGTARSTMFEVGGVAGLTKVDFFAHFDWEKLEQKQIEPPAVFAVDHDGGGLRRECKQALTPLRPGRQWHVGNPSRQTVVHSLELQIHRAGNDEVERLGSRPKCTIDFSSSCHQILDTDIGEL